MYFNEPVSQSGAYLFIDFMLIAHICSISIPFMLNIQHILMNFLAKLWDMVNVTKGVSIYPLYLTVYLILAPLVEHLQLLIETDSG